MSKLSTRYMDDYPKKRREASKKVASPSNQTIDFLKQFARTYHAEPSLGPSLCSLVLN